MATKLTNAYKLRQKFGLGEHVVRGILEALTPKAEYPYGRGVQRMYDEAEAFAACRGYIQRQAMAEAPQVPTPPTDIGLVLKAIDALNKRLDDVAEDMRAMDSKLTEQARLSFKRVESTAADVTKIVKGLIG